MTDFIELTENYGQKVLISKSSIATIKENDNLYGDVYTQILLCTGKIINVKETYHEIKKLLLQ